MNKEQLQAICNAAGIEYERPLKDGYHIYMEVYDWNGKMEPHGMYHLFDEDGALCDIQTTRTILNIPNNRRPVRHGSAIQGPAKKGRKEGSTIKKKTITVPSRNGDVTIPVAKLALSKPQLGTKAASQNLMKQRAEAFLASKKQYQCGACGEMGHNARTCSKK